MRILILGGDGYLGWPTALHFSDKGHEVMVVDNFIKRQIEFENSIEPLRQTPPLARRVALWHEISNKKIEMRVGDLLNHRFVYNVLDEFKPESIIHYAEQPSAPYSMIGREQAVRTMHNNVTGNMNLLFGIQSKCPDAHLIKLGTMGEYGTPNIDIEEGYLDITHNGRNETIPFPKRPHSFYHLSKVHDTNNILFTCRVWGLKATDLNQGVVYGNSTEQVDMHDGLRTSFHYDEIFGTALNRFCTQAAIGKSLTVYGKGGQTWGFLNVRDTIRCVELASENPPQPGICEIMNQFTETFSIKNLAELVNSAAREMGLKTTVDHIPNPRDELEDHYYNAKNEKLLKLGLNPHLLSKQVLQEIIKSIKLYKHHVDTTTIMPNIKWRQN